MGIITTCRSRSPGAPTAPGLRERHTPTKEPTMPVCKYLDLSTAHITKEDSLRIRDLARPRVIAHEYGWWIHVPSDPADVADMVEAIRDADMSDDFLAMMHEARNLGCAWINLDQDADHHAALSVNNW